MDEINKKAIERMNDILDAIKVENDAIMSPRNNQNDDLIASETIENLTRAFDLIYRNMR